MTPRDIDRILASRPVPAALVAAVAAAGSFRPRTVREKQLRAKPLPRARVPLGRLLREPCSRCGQAGGGLLLCDRCIDALYPGAGPDACDDNPEGGWE